MLQYNSNEDELQLRCQSGVSEIGTPSPLWTVQQIGKLPSDK